MKLKTDTTSTFLTVKDLAAHLRISTKTVRRFINSGALKAHRVGRQIRVSAEDLATYEKLARAS